MKAFLAQKYNLLVTRVCKFLVPHFLRRNQLKVRIDSRCLDELKTLGKSSVVLLFNHSDRYDPLVVAELSRITGEDFSYIASREQFEGFWGLQGWLLQHCGAYSVLRGEPEDKESKEATIEYISDSQRKLVEFPEGDVTGRDDTVLPLKEDGIKNILEAQQRKIKNGEKDPVFLLPIGIYYEVQKDGIQAMKDCLARLEKHLDLMYRQLPLAERIDRVIAALIFNLERAYGINTFGARLDQRLLSICSQVAESIAFMNGLQIQRVVRLKNVVSLRNQQKSANEVMIYLHSVRNQLWRSLKEDRRILTHTNIERYQKRLVQGALQRKRSCIADLDKLEQLLILSHTIQQRLTTLNHAWRVVDRLEQEITGKTTLKGHRVAYLDAGPVINLLQFMPAYSGSVDGAIGLVDKSVRQKILYALTELKSRHAVA